MLNQAFVRAVNAFDKLKSHEGVFESFRAQPELYQFVHNGDSPPDPEAVDIAKSIDLTIYECYIGRNKNKKKIGYTGASSTYADYDKCDSRHIMMSMILFKNLPEPVSNIVEIGGGFANWLYLNNDLQRFEKWTIIDLPHLGLLQKWAIEQFGIPKTKYELVSAFDYDSWAEIVHVDLVIGAHSLSEFAWDVFLKYFDKVVIKSKYLFYSYKHAHKRPSQLAYIMNKFDLVEDVLSQSGTVSNALYVRKP